LKRLNPAILRVLAEELEFWGTPMSDPTALREKAAQCRRLARRPRRGFPQSSGHNYLLELADRFEHEATMLERTMAGSKPGSGVAEPSTETVGDKPQERTDEPAARAGTTDPFRAS
jgi:hypothetical protein